MWIIPSNHPLYSAFARECLASKEDLSEQSEELTQSLMWRSKPSSLKTWSSRWNKVYWLPHLFGRMLKPSPNLRHTFATKYTESLVDIHANLSRQQANDKEQKTQDTFFRIYHLLLTQLDLFGASSKTSQDTFQWDMSKFTEALEIWATELRLESTLRSKRAHLTREKDYLSLQSEAGQTWSTPRVGGQEGYETRLVRGKDMGLQGQVEYLEKKTWATPIQTDHREKRDLTNGKNLDKNNLEYGIQLSQQVKYLEGLKWATPTVMATRQEMPLDQIKIIQDKLKEKKINGNGFGLNLHQQVRQWPTPTVMEAGKVSNAANYGQLGLSNHPAIVGLPTREKTTKGDSTGGRLNLDKINSIGKNQEQSLKKSGENRVLNPAWVLQLMGTTLEKTFFAWQEMESLNKQQK